MSDLMHGFLNIDKPIGMTSHDVVAKVRWLLRQRGLKPKVGHAGTLDPLATGVLVVCIGGATRLSDYVMASSKTYDADIRMGITTDTYDAEGAVLLENDVSHLTLAQIEAALPPFIGQIAQIPPMYSAIKVDGKKLYELARAGQEIALTARSITIHAIDILAWNNPVLSVRVRCSSGTYIRSLAYDIGQALGVGAHLSGLRRTQSGGFLVDQAISLETLSTTNDWSGWLMQPYQALLDYPSIDLNAEMAIEVGYGRSIPILEGHPTADEVMAYTDDQHLFAILERRENLWKPRKVFPPIS